MITQMTYEALKNAARRLEHPLLGTKPICSAKEIRELHDLLVKVTDEIDEEIVAQSPPERIFLNISDDVPDGTKFEELDREFVTWSSERVYKNDLEYVLKK